MSGRDRSELKLPSRREFEEQKRLDSNGVLIGFVKRKRIKKKKKGRKGVCCCVCVECR